VILKKGPCTKHEEGCLEAVLIMGWIINTKEHSKETHEKMVEAIASSAFNNNGLMAHA
jgi:hypothetical protein